MDHSPFASAPELARLLSAAAAGERPWSATAEFRDALYAYVDSLRAQGFDVVQTRLEVKRALSPISPSLLEQSAKWSIERFYQAR